MPTFISTPITVAFDEEPVIRKRAGAPDRFEWTESCFEVIELLAEWHDYDKGRETVQTRRTQATLDRQHGSWGVGRDWYRVRTRCGRIFDLYYDRRPKNRTIIGSWILFREWQEGEWLL